MENKNADHQQDIHAKINRIIREAGKCMHCGICSAGCPSGRHTNLNIRRLLRKTLKSRDIPDEQLWMCTTCYNCQERCPRAIKIVDILLDIRALSVREGRIMPEHRVVCEMLLQYGHAVPINEENRIKRVHMGLDELPETVHKYNEGLEEVQKLLSSCGFDRLIMQSE